MSSKDIFSVVGLDKSNQHKDIPERDKIVQYLKGVKKEPSRGLCGADVGPVRPLTARRLALE